MEAIFFDVQTTHLPGQFCKRVIFPHYFLSCFHTGFVYERNGVLLVGNPGDMLIIPPNTPVYHGPLPNAQEGFINDWLYLQCDEMQELLERYPLPLHTPFQANAQQLFRQYLDAIIAESDTNLPGHSDLLLHLTCQFIIHLYREYTNQQSTPRSRIQQTREVILSSPEKQWTLQSMADLSGYSSSRFSALYRSQFGLSPKQDLLACRIEKSKKLLRYTSFTISEIARSCGFQTIHYFSKYFKLSVGIPPSDYACTYPSNQEKTE